MKVFPWISIICFAQIWKPSFLRSKKLSPIKEISTAGFACNSLYRRTRITWRTKCKMWIFIGFLDLKNLYLQMHWNTMWGIAMIIWRPLKEYDAASFQPYIIFYILHYIFVCKSSSNSYNWISFNASSSRLLKLIFRFREHFNKLLICKSSYEEPFLVSSSWPTLCIWLHLYFVVFDT